MARSIGSSHGCGGRMVRSVGSSHGCGGRMARSIGSSHGCGGRMARSIGSSLGCFVFLLRQTQGVIAIPFLELVAASCVLCETRR